MYELIDISPTVITSYFEAIEKADKHPNANKLFIVAVKNTFHTLEPRCPNGVAQNFSSLILIVSDSLVQSRPKV
ncbi:hypothetical protein Sulku_1419 [Sulfuricurvum kujiense DSM 16994]|uniref:Uncharacterized protein n=1 Tax=Sulfuricurvum kujiense (strain ATCC BAA-921 / DSM 16994 / JCM 11577 / YK-1) TaxID=709032 RepID=E4TYU0_SULKY|nr:hypothetical protein Sulku_1419 [Sulfuricurvum kujiense DSM 16994]